MTPDQHFRNDSPNGITPPNPDANVSHVDHITKARGKRTQFTSVSQDADSIRHFSGELYRCSRIAVQGDGHTFVEHNDLVDGIRQTILKSRREEKIKAERALQYTTRAKEALINWKFDFRRVPRKDRITRCGDQIQAYFTQC